MSGSSSITRIFFISASGVLDVKFNLITTYYSHQNCNIAKNEILNVLIGKQKFEKCYMIGIFEGLAIQL